mgnify:CR=1 FL=1
MPSTTSEDRCVTQQEVAHHDSGGSEAGGICRGNGLGCPDADLMGMRMANALRLTVPGGLSLFAFSVTAALRGRGVKRVIRSEDAAGPSHRAEFGRAALGIAAGERR